MPNTADNILLSDAVQCYKATITEQSLEITGKQEELQLHRCV